MYGRQLLQRIFCAAACALLLAGTFCGCSHIDDGTFTVSITALPASLDPQLAENDGERTAAVNLYEGLFRQNAEGGADPAACESWQVSPDGLTWTFTLRGGLHYNDSGKTSVTSADFAFALRRLFALGSGSPYTQTFSGLAGAQEILAGTADVTALGVSTPDEQTLVLQLASPDEALPQKLCCPGAMPCNEAFYNSCEGTYGLNGDSLLSNGAFQLTLWDEENGVTLRRVQPAQGRVNRIRMLVAAGDADPAALLAAGTISGAFLDGVPQDDTVPIVCTKTQMLLFNCTADGLSQAQVRAGLSAVALQNLPETDAEGLATAGGLVPDSVTLGGKSWRSQAGSLLGGALPADAAAAYRSGLAAAGLAKLSGVTVLVPDTPYWHALYDAVSLAWQTQLSAFFSVKYLPEKEVLAAVADGEYQMAFVTVGAEQDSVREELGFYASGAAGSLTLYADPQYDALLAAADAADSSAARAAALRSAESYLLAQWCAAPVRTVSSYFSTAAGFYGIVASPFGPTLDFTAAKYSA